MVELRLTNDLLGLQLNGDPSTNKRRSHKEHFKVAPTTPFNQTGLRQQIGIMDFFNGKAGWILFITRDSDCRVARTETTQKEMLLAAPGGLRRSPV